MASLNRKELLVALDVGSSKVCALVGEMDATGQCEIIGVGTQPSRGLKRGVVVDIDSTVQAITRAVQEAERMVNCKIHAVYTGLSGAHIRSFNSHGIVKLQGLEVTAYDVERVIDAARAVPLSADQKPLHIVPQEYIIDNQEGVREPIGMAGIRLEARIHLIAAANSAMQNLTKCVQRCNLSADDMVFAALAAGEVALSDDEKELGTCLIDIGAGTTDIAIYTEGAVRHTAVIPLAGNQVTSDIAAGLGTPVYHAETVKLEHGCALAKLASATQMITVPGIAERPAQQLSRRALAGYIEPRYREILEFVQRELVRSGYQDLLAGGVVMTGGAVQMEGLVPLAEEIFCRPVRLGSILGVTGLPQVVNGATYVTTAGILVLGSRHRQTRLVRSVTAHGNLWQRFKRWLEGHY